MDATLMLVASLSYCYYLAKKIPKGKPRLVSLIPIFYLLSLFPWTFSSAFGRGMSSFFVTWITSFKLTLFCFDRGPLAALDTFPDFALISILPLRVRRVNSHVDDDDQPRNPLLSLSSRYETVPLMNRPYLATSLKDFWGRRWNRMSSDILRLTVYDPAREGLLGLVGPGLAGPIATVATLVVSGAMHEMVFYYITCGGKPTWEVGLFFVLHGICMVLEAGFKRLARVRKWDPVHPALLVVLTVGFAVGTSYWLLVLPVWRSARTQQECVF